MKYSEKKFKKNLDKASVKNGISEIYLNKLKNNLEKNIIKPIFDRDYFHDYSKKGNSYGENNLELKDIMLVHVTDTFPDKGIMKPTAYHDKNSLRYTIHFALNGIFGAHQDHSLGGSAKDKTNRKATGRNYCILIPAEKMKDQISLISPEDTFVVGDIKLPEGSIIIGNEFNLKNKDAGKAKLIVKDVGEGKPEDVPKLRNAVSEVEIDEGYMPMGVSDYGWETWVVNDPSIQKFATDNELDSRRSKGSYRNSMKFGGHWTGNLELKRLDLDNSNISIEDKLMEIDDIKKLVTDLYDGYYDLMINKYKSYHNSMLRSKKNEISNMINVLYKPQFQKDYSTVPKQLKQIGLEIESKDNEIPFFENNVKLFEKKKQDPKELEIILKNLDKLKKQLESEQDKKN